MATLIAALVTCRAHKARSESVLRSVWLKRRASAMVSNPRSVLRDGFRKHHAVRRCRRRPNSLCPASRLCLSSDDAGAVGFCWIPFS